MFINSIKLIKIFFKTIRFLDKNIKHHYQNVHVSSLIISKITTK